jgi:hypothetical protein
LTGAKIAKYVCETYDRHSNGKYPDLVRRKETGNDDYAHQRKKEYSHLG